MPPLPAALAISEADFQAQVVEVAKLCGWRVYHPWLSVKSAKGYPDLTLVRGGRLIFVELKSERGYVSAEQHEWLDALTQAGQAVFVWRPRDWPLIEKALAR